MPPILIRNASKKDARFLGQMIYQSGTTIQRALLKDRAEEILARLVTSDEGLFSYHYGHLATQGNELLGAMICYPTDDLSKEAGRYLRQLYHLVDLPTFAVTFFKQALISLSILPKQPGDFYLAHLAVESSSRNRGVGGALLNKLGKLARHHNARRIVLDVELNNPRARSFYEQNGWREKGQKASVVSPSFLGTPGFIRMVRELPVRQSP